MSNAVRAVITGRGMAVPAKVMTNADFEKILDTSDDWIIQRTGIRGRHVVSEGESTATLATTAARGALDEAGWDPLPDLIICATVTPEMVFPSTACFVQEGLKLANVPAFDISAACSGFLYAMSVGSKFIETGAYKKVVVIGADVLSRFTDYTDRGSSILFGDGAGAVVLEPTTDLKRGILYSVLCADGGGWNYIHVPAGGSRSPASHQTVDDHQHFIKMRGRDVYKFAVEKMQWLLGNCLEHCNLTVDQVDMVIPHQVNLRIIESAAGKYDLPMDKVYINIDHYGNTSGASVPLALCEATRAGRIGPGSLVLMVAFGAGLTWAGTVVRI